jgi:hypothetical protein
MRTTVLIAAPLLVAGSLVAGCSRDGEVSRPAALTPISPSHSRTATSEPGATVSQTVTAAPPAGASSADAIAWVEAAGTADTADFHIALRGATSVSIGDDVAFTTPFGATCMTEVTRAPGLACLVSLTDPPKQPPEVYGVWKGGWVDFDGTSVRIGSAHGDPGRFAAGRGAPLPTDRSLAFGDYRCRTATTTLVCVNYAHRTAGRYSDGGVDAYGCARLSPPAAGIGIEYRC